MPGCPPTSGTLPTSAPQRARPPDAPRGRPIPAQPGMPPLAEALWAWVCVEVGGAAVPGNQARSVCLAGGRSGGPAPSLPLSRHPPRLPSLSGLLDRPSRWAALLKLGPESSLPCPRWGEDFGVRKVEGGKGGSPSTRPSAPRGTRRPVSTTENQKMESTGRAREGEGAASPSRL